MLERLQAAAVSTALILAPLPALAASPEAAPAETEPAAAQPAPAQPVAQTPLAQAEALYNEGRTHFETAEYIQALIAWNKAYVLLDSSPEHRGTRTALAYNIAEGHKHAYEVSRNPEHLHEAKRLLTSRKTELAGLDQNDPAVATDQAQTDERIAQLDELLYAAGARGEVSQVLPQGTTFVYDEPATAAPAHTTPAAAPAKPMSPKQQWEHEVKQDPELGPKWAKSKKQFSGGVVMLSVGGGLGLISAGAFVLGAPFSPFQWFLIGTGAVFGAAAIGLLAGGGVSLSRGIKGKNEVYAAKPRPTTWLVPMPMMTAAETGEGTRVGVGAGLGVVGRF
ncbi:hypothetical protein PPSIR1_00365 [Plesiocystis pacifica SIR-1]|uniref:Uncharacterized protein n=1 Tax=Plesiocystis pacifica SIR-1 TaxID=391625 RepID=A6GGB9_9BACT|nr:hypothetical protein [Plesiocystis pacifica]EDM75093.1 hypothetical protein PPSIR1_00365 [Plesiocystis pacifica SIR-1]